MRPRLAYLLSAALLITISCSKSDPDDDGLEEPGAEAVETEVITEFIDDDIEKIVLFNLFSMSQAHESGGGVIETHLTHNPYIGRNDCASVSFEEESSRLVIDFGTGCESDRGLLRAGKIIAELSELAEEVYGTIRITLDNYSVEEIAVNGIRLLAIDTETDKIYSEYTSTVESGSIVFSDQTEYTYENSRNVSYQVLGNQDDEFSFVTSYVKAGTNRSNETFSSSGTITYQSHCFEEGIGLPSSGSVEIIINNQETLITFSGTECQTIVDIRPDNGSPYKLDLRNLRINN